MLYKNYIKINKRLAGPLAAVVESGKAAVLSRWYRDQVWNSAVELIAEWQPIMGVRVRKLFVQHHLLERKHGDRFVALMDGFLPQWKAARQKLNQILVRHENWDY